MLSKTELREKNILFWNEFTSYMSSDRSSNGKKMNWLNYPTDIKYIFLRLEADKFGARIHFDIQAKDTGVRAVIWEQMEELKKVLSDSMGDSGIWMPEYSTNEIAAFSRIKWEITDVNFFVEDDKQKIFSFFREKLIAFDEFYQNFKEILILLVK